MRQKFDVNALFCDETKEYRRPMEPDPYDRVTLSFRTGKDQVEVVRYLEIDTKLVKEMDRVSSDELFDCYETVITVGKDPVDYCFEVVAKELTIYYNRYGCCKDIKEGVPFRILPGFHIPVWAQGAIMYQIYVDRFYNGDPTNDVEDGEYYYIDSQVHRARDWKQYPSTMDVGQFYGGDLQGILDKLDYLQSLKVEVIYLSPIFVSPSNHKYDCQDYEHIDPHLAVITKDEGQKLLAEVNSNEAATLYATRSASKENLEASDQFFVSFVEEAHRRGMKVILDGVFNHCGSFNKWLDRELIYQLVGDYEEGAYVSDSSPYSTFFKFNEEGSWPKNDSYDGWWGHSTLPKLNYEESPKLYGYIMEIAKKWVSPPFNVDGWRLDVAADLGRTSEFNHQFWRDFRKHVKQANPEAIILAEHYGDPRDWLQGDQWDTVMNYDAFMEPVSWFLTGMEKHSDEYQPHLEGNGEVFFQCMTVNMAKLPANSLMTAMNELSNHDHSRFLTRTNKTVGRIGPSGPEAASVGISYGLFRAAVMIHMTWPGAPTIYYGDETGVCGWTDPDNRRTYPWGEENQELIEFFKYMSDLHNRNKAIKAGSLKALLAGDHVIAYGRFTRDNQCVVAVNSSDESKQLQVPVWQLGLGDGQVMTRRMLTYEEGYNAGAVSCQVKQGMLEVELPARGSAFFSVRKEV